MKQNILAKGRRSKKDPRRNSEVKNTIPKIKNSQDGFNSRMKMIEERIIKLERRQQKLYNNNNRKETI